MCDFTTLNITLWNATSITQESIDFTLQNINPMTQLFFITETWLLPTQDIKTPWTKHHNYAQKTTNEARGKNGISLLIHPDFPYPVIADTPTSIYALTCRLKNYIIICFYIPPSCTPTEFSNIINTELDKHDSINDNIILCGDFNCRMGLYLNDKNNSNVNITNNRCNPFLEIITERGLTLWNKELAYGKPTLIKGSTILNVQQSSIIDLFLSNNKESIINEKCFSENRFVGWYSFIGVS
ncbi:Endonuclease/exonuclease/phosphatase [Helicostylum pulchrum]|nr:Endonuclease/exonuclease/phosphatase [Helicostylum pulchrum]